VLAEPPLEREHADADAVVHVRKCRFDPSAAERAPIPRSRDAASAVCADIGIVRRRPVTPGMIVRRVFLIAGTASFAVLVGAAIAYMGA
jgi:hypothetical protein